MIPVLLPNHSGVHVHTLQLSESAQALLSIIGLLICYNLTTVCRPITRDNNSRVQSYSDNNGIGDYMDFGNKLQNRLAKETVKR